MVVSEIKNAEQFWEERDVVPLYAVNRQEKRARSRRRQPPQRKPRPTASWSETCYFHGGLVVVTTL